MKVGAMGLLGLGFAVLAGCCSHPCRQPMISQLCVGSSCVSDDALQSMQIGFNSSSDLSVQFSGTNFSTSTSGTSLMVTDSAGNNDIVELVQHPQFYPSTVIKIKDNATGEILDVYRAPTQFSGTSAVFINPEELDFWVAQSLTNYVLDDVSVSVNIPKPKIKKANILSPTEARVNGFSINAGTETLVSSAISISSGSAH